MGRYRTTGTTATTSDPSLATAATSGRGSKTAGERSASASSAHTALTLVSSSSYENASCVTRASSNNSRSGTTVGTTTMASERSKSTPKNAGKKSGNGSMRGRRTNGLAKKADPNNTDTVLRQQQHAGLASATDMDMSERDLRTTSSNTPPLSSVSVGQTSCEATSETNSLRYDVNGSMTDTLNSGSQNGGTNNDSNGLVRKLDKFGFIINVDSNGNILDANAMTNELPPTRAQAELSARRTKKWHVTMATWDRRRPKVLLRRLRKGIPDAIRGRAWLLLAGGIREPGLYHEILRRTAHATLLDGSNVEPNPDAFAEAMSKEVKAKTRTRGAKRKGKKKKSKSLLPDEKDDNGFVESKEYITAIDAIERDVHRTYPKHSMFFEDDEEDDIVDLGVSGMSDDNSNDNGLNGLEQSNLSTQTASTDIVEGNTLLRSLCDPELANLISNMEQDMIKKRAQYSGTPSSNGEDEASNLSVEDDDNDDKKSEYSAKPSSVRSAPSAPVSSVQSPRIPGGQLALRRVLRAYSYYDREVGYCQGMNFIAGMFLTIMSEEEAFWMLVSVMQDKPCEMRGLFGEGMRETHMVLHVAERLIQHHLPKLFKHFEKERIHVTMFVTQWLLTQYTSSFRFDLVTRVWDCFLGEGWKIIYRVMLSLLAQWQAPLLSMPFEDILGFFRDMPNTVDGATIVDNALKIPLRRKHIVAYEKEWQAKQNQAER